MAKKTQEEKNHDAILKELASWFSNIPENVITSSIKNFYSVINQNMRQHRNMNIGIRNGKIIGTKEAKKLRLLWKKRRKEIQDKKNLKYRNKLKNL